MIDSVVFSPLKGFAFFVLNPRLWLKPLLIMIVAALVLGLIFSYSIWGYWPSSAENFWHYTLGVAKAFGISTLIAVIVWAFFITILLNYAFDSMLRKALKIEGLLTNELSFVGSFAVGIQVMMRTLGWRIFWPVFTLVAIFFLPFASALIGQLGIGHMAVIDGAGMTMSFLGYGTQKQLGVYKTYRSPLLLMGIVSGVGSFLLLPTFVVWLFWLPGTYIGVAFWIARHLEHKT